MDHAPDAPGFRTAPGYCGGAVASSGGCGERGGPDRIPDRRRYVRVRNVWRAGGSFRKVPRTSVARGGCCGDAAQYGQGRVAGSIEGFDDVSLRRRSGHRTVAPDSAVDGGKPRRGTLVAVPRSGGGHQPDMGRAAAAFRPVSAGPVYGACGAGTRRARRGRQGQAGTRNKAGGELFRHPAVASVF